MIRAIIATVASLAATIKLGWQFRELPWWEPDLPAL